MTTGTDRKEEMYTQIPEGEMLIESKQRERERLSTEKERYDIDR